MSFVLFKNLGCWFPPKFNKVIVLMIDGLPFDLMLSNISQVNPFSFFNAVKKNHPDKMVFFKFFSEPPTTMVQRLKSLSTGSLSTHIDFRSNLGKGLIEEDNLIRQMKNSGKKVIYLGDSSWKELYHQDNFKNSYFYSPYGIKVIIDSFGISLI